MKIRLLGWTFMAISFLASCSDEEIVADVKLPQEMEQAQAEGLESYSYSIPFEVKSDTEWKIEFDEIGEEIAYVYPASGKGSATIYLYVLDNLTDEARQGNMTVVFPEDKSKNKVVTLKQKAKDSSDENFSKDAVGNITYGVGYGFNVVTGVGARAIKAQIIKAELLSKENLVQKAPTSSASIEFDTYYGSTIKEMSNNFSMSPEFSGKPWGIEAEANTKFDMNLYNKEEYQYAMSFVDVSKEQITITLNEDEWGYWNDLDEGCYTKAAYKALNGINRKYPSTDEGFKKLFDSFGTHVIRTATLGGRLTIATTVNTSDISNEYDLEAFAKLSYSGIVDVSSEVDNKFKNSFKKNSSACQTKISALGGSTSIFNNLNDLVGEGAKKAANTWFGSLNDDESSWTFIGLDGMDNLIPIWELVEDSERARLMQEYFESGRYAAKINEGVMYDMGIQARLEGGIPDFEAIGTQIADIKTGADSSKTVARVCNEFIPHLDEKGPVKVVYPVINGKVKWNMGWFVGNEYYSPCRVINMDGKIKVEEIYGENTVGEAKDIYIRGVRIGSKPVDEQTPKSDAVSVLHYERLMRNNELGDYTVVKILDMIWMNQNFQGTANMDGDGIGFYLWSSYNKNEQEYYLYSADIVGISNVFPAGWVHLNHDKAIQKIIDFLNENKVNVFDAFAYGGYLRFNAHATGIVARSKSHYSHAHQESFLMTLRAVSGKWMPECEAFYLNPQEGTYEIGKHIFFNFFESGAQLCAPIRAYKPIQ